MAADASNCKAPLSAFGPRFETKRIIARAYRKMRMLFGAGLEGQLRASQAVERGKKLGKGTSPGAISNPQAVLGEEPIPIFSKHGEREMKRGAESAETETAPEVFSSVKQESED